MEPACLRSVRREEENGLPTNVTSNVVSNTDVNQNTCVTSNLGKIYIKNYELPACILPPSISVAGVRGLPCQL